MSELREEIAKIIEPTSYMRSSNTTLQAERIIALCKAEFKREAVEIVNGIKPEFRDDLHAVFVEQTIKAIEGM